MKGKARAEKSGEDEIGLDDDSTAISTAAAGIKMLCYYGRRHEVEQSLKITKVVEDWLQKLHNPKLSPKPAVSANDLPEDLMEQPRAIKSPVHGKALALGYHALAIGQSYWARTTYETSSRSELQSKALANFRKALEPELGEEDNVEILYSFAFVLAETREIDPAIAIIKRALSPGTKAPSMNGVATADFASDNADYEPPTDADSRGLLLRSWHLLALLLSVRHEFATAIASCEAALDLYGNKSILYGNTRRLDTSGLALSERKNIIEIKVTQLALSEVVDGPEEAVNSSGELLGLYAELFKHVQKPAFKIQVPFQSPPSSANGTLRSLRGSILGLPKDPTLKSRNTGLRAQDTTSGSLPSFETPEEDTRPPTISVTGLDGATSRNTNHHSHFLGRHESNKLRKRNSRKSMVSRRTSRAPSPSKPSSSEEPHRPHSNLHLPFRNRHDEQSTTDGSGNTLYMDSNQYASDEVGVAISHDLPSIPSTPAAASDPQNPLHATPSTTQNMNHRNPNTHPVPPNPPSQQPTNPPTTPSLSPLLEPHYPPAEESRHALALLTKIWLVISSLYRRASMPADAQGALSEATTHVQSIELDIANREGSSAKNFSTPGFGGLKACGELWADVLAEQATLHVQLGDINAASEAFEKALVHWPDHVAATIGLCNILLDEYSAPHLPPSSPPSTTAIPPSTPTLATLPILPSASPPKATKPTDQQDLLSRLAARDRAYGLLSALTKSGAGWDCGEAWMAFARAEEESGMLGRAEEALWWVVGLEGGRAVRGLGCLIG